LRSVSSGLSTKLPRELTKENLMADIHSRVKHPSYEGRIVGIDRYSSLSDSEFASHYMAEPAGITG